MAISSISGVRLAGVSACVPKARVANAESKLLGPEDIQKVIKATGIEYRRMAPSEQCSSDLAFAAATKLLDDLGWSRSEIDVIVFVTQSGDYLLPATSFLLADRLGIGRGAIAFDVNLGCSGFTTGLSIVASMLSALGVRRGLLLCGDTPSKSVSPQDRSAALLFGDGGAAAALELSAGQRIDFDCGSDGSGWKAINIPDGGYRNVVTASSLERVKIDEGISRNRCELILDGVEVFNFSIREVPKTVKALMDHLAVGVDEVDAFVFHQANMMMNETIRKKLKVPPEKMPYSLRNFGNTSSASIPVTMVTELGEKLRSGPNKLLLCGFGVGLSWTTAYLQTDKLVCPPLIEA